MKFARIGLVVFALVSRIVLREGRNSDMRFVNSAAANLTVVLLLCGLTFSNSASAGGNVDAGKSLATTCAACHGQDGNTGLMPEYPKLAGQNERYLADQLRMIQSGERLAPLMAGQLIGKSEQQLQDLAAYYASLSGAIGQSSDDNFALGEKIYRGGILKKNVSACTACHSPSGSGNSLAGFPKISGQSMDYVVEQLRKYREGERTTDDNNGGMMRQIAGGLTDGEIRAVANYVQGLH